MRPWIMVPLLLVGCGPKEAGLPADPVQRAATCGVVAAAAARKASANVDAKLTMEQQGRILHYGLLAGSEGGSFDQTRTAAVVNAMPALGEKVTGGKWETLIPQCEAAFPQTKASDLVELPKDPLVAQAGCHDLSDFITTALRASEADYVERIRAYDSVRRNIDPKLGIMLKTRGFGQEAGKAARDKAVAALVQLGSPAAVLDQCVRRFGDSQTNE